MTDPRRLIPRTDVVLAHPAVRDASSGLDPHLVKQTVVSVLAGCRAGQIRPESAITEVLAALPRSASSMRQIINATGVIVHTNLGRSALSEAAVAAVTRAAGTTNVEFDLSTGTRGPRGAEATRALLERIDGAEAVHLVNNGAAALALVSCAMAAGRSVIVARGEMVEIGDGFRIPELVESVGATLREVGTTNRVHLGDYAAAIDETTAFVLKVHPSNFVVSGFTSTVSVNELSTLPVPTVMDVGSGLLAPHPRLPDEPDVSSILRAGAHLVTASGDKLLGGPQCGLIAGRRAAVETVRRHPLARAMRVDKLTLAALEATLRGPQPPTLTALESDPERLWARARSIVADLADVVAAEPVKSEATVGGGAAPTVSIPSAAVALPASLAERLRALDEPVVGRIEHDRLLLDLIAIPCTDDGRLVAAVRAASSSIES